MKTRDKIISLRKRLGFSRYEFAEQLECTYTTIYYWEHGDRMPSFKQSFKMIELARHYGIVGVTLDWLRPDS